MEQERIDAAVATLSKRQQEVFELRYYDKKTVEEIAAELGISHQAVSAIFERAEKNLQRIFSETVAK
jgi:RNA polymerase sigma factor (sigma-70 family)